MLILGQQSFRWIDVDDHGREYHHSGTSVEMDGTLKIAIFLWGPPLKYLQINAQG